MFLRLHSVSGQDTLLAKSSDRDIRVAFPRRLRIQVQIHSSTETRHFSRGAVAPHTTEAPSGVFAPHSTAELCTSEAPQSTEAANGVPVLHRASLPHRAVKASGVDEPHKASFPQSAVLPVRAVLTPQGSAAFDECIAAVDTLQIGRAPCR